MAGVLDLLAGILPEDFGDNAGQDPGLSGAAFMPQQRPQADVPMPRPKPPFLSGQTAPQAQAALGQEVRLGNQGAPGVGWAPGLDEMIGAGSPQPPPQPGDGIGGPPSLPGMSTEDAAMAQAGNAPIPGPPPSPPQVAQNIPLPPPRPASAPQPAPGMPLPPPRPPNIPQPSAPLAPGGPAALPPNAMPTAGGGTENPTLARPAPPPPPPFAGPQRGNGPYPESLPVDKTRKAMAGMAAGLGSIQGPGRFASFARGAGQGMAGSEKNQETQEKQNQSAQGQHFNQLSTSFKDKLAALASGNQQAYRDAQAKYLTARANALDRGSNAYQNTPQRLVLDTEKQVNTEKDRATKVLQEQWKLNGTAEAQQNAQLQALEQRFDQRKAELYRRAGIDPQKAEKIKTMGETKENPFDARTMSPDQFHSQVPIGGFYINKDGKVYERKAPPPGQQHSEADTAPYQDDQMAMTEAASPS